MAAFNRQNKAGSNSQPLGGSVNSSNDEMAYSEKLKEFQKYVEPLRLCIDRLRESGDPEKVNKESNKMRTLLEILTSERRSTLDVLIKCEPVLQKIQIQSKNPDTIKSMGKNKIATPPPAASSAAPLAEHPNHPAAAQVVPPMIPSSAHVHPNMMTHQVPPPPHPNSLPIQSGPALANQMAMASAAANLPDSVPSPAPSLSAGMSPASQSLLASAGLSQKSLQDSHNICAPLVDIISRIITKPGVVHTIHRTFAPSMSVLEGVPNSVSVNYDGGVLNDGELNLFY